MTIHKIEIRAISDAFSGQVELHHKGECILTTSFFLEQRYKGESFPALWYTCQRRVEISFPFGTFYVSI